jgi:hypothetical protein
VERRTGPQWRDGYLVGDGTCFPLFQKSELHGESFYDRKCNYFLNCQVLSYYILLSCAFSDICFRLLASHTIYKLWTMLLAWLEGSMTPLPFQLLVLPRNQSLSLLQMSGCGQILHIHVAFGVSHLSRSLQEEDLLHSRGILIFICLQYAFVLLSHTC